MSLTTQLIIQIRSAVNPYDYYARKKFASEILPIHTIHFEKCFSLNASFSLRASKPSHEADRGAEDITSMIGVMEV